MKINPDLLIECDDDAEASELINLTQRLIAGTVALAGPTCPLILCKWMDEAAGILEEEDTYNRRTIMALQVAPVRFALSAALHFER